MTSLETDCLIAGATILLAMFTAAYIMAATGKLVIFYNYGDVRECGIVVVVILISILCFSVRALGTTPTRNLLWCVCFFSLASLSAYLAFNVYRSAVAQNRSPVLGIVAGSFKLMFVVVVLALIIGNIRRYADKDRREGLNKWDFLVIGLIIAFLAYLTKSMVNGERVYESKGWELNS